MKDSTIINIKCVVIVFLWYKVVVIMLLEYMWFVSVANQNYRFQKNCIAKSWLYSHWLHQGSVRLIKEEAEDSRSSSVNESDSEDSADKESSSNSKEKIKEPIQKKNRLSSRSLPNKFSFRKRNFKSELL